MKKLIFFAGLLAMAVISQSFYEVAMPPKMESTEAMTLMQQNCANCHSMDPNVETSIAPSMFSIKKHYLEKYPNKDNFVNAVKAFMENPVLENVVMPMAVKQFGQMPKLSFSQTQIQEMATYLYNFDVENAKSLKASIMKVDTNYADMGRTYAMRVKSILGRNLMGAISKDGTEKALVFCNHRAIVLTDSVSKSLNVSVKRVSDKARNPQNKANLEELNVIESFKQKLAQGEILKPLVVAQSSSVTAYIAIESNKMCLQCHGDANKDITPQVMDKIRQLYPNDVAIGYTEGQIRGVFVVQMNKIKK